MGQSQTRYLATGHTNRQKNLYASSF